MLDLIIKNGQCYIEGKLENKDIAVKDGKISKIGEISEESNYKVYYPENMLGLNIKKDIWRKNTKKLLGSELF